VSERIIASTTTPAGRTVLLTDRTWAHVVTEHFEMRGQLAAVLNALKTPDYYQVDSRPGRERYFKRAVGPDRWLRVVVQFRGDHDVVVTAFGQSNPPGTSR
jgi:hypothetical protein